MAVADGDGAREVFEKMIDAYMSGDADGVVALLDDEFHVIGNLAHEEWESDRDALRAYLEEDLANWRNVGHGFLDPRGRSIDGRPSVRQAGPDVAVLSTGVTLEAEFRGREVRHQGRWTCLARLRDGEWRIFHSHFSLGD